MGTKAKAGMWCDYCQEPVAGQKGTHRARGVAVAVTALPTAGLSLLGAKPEGYHCANCGQPVRRGTRDDMNQASQVRAIETGVGVELRVATVPEPLDKAARKGIEKVVLVLMKVLGPVGDPHAWGKLYGELQLELQKPG